MYFFFFNYINTFFKYKLLIFLKKKNIFFLKKDTFKKIIYWRVLSKSKPKQFVFKNKYNKQKNYYLLDNTSRFLSTIISNRGAIKFFFFKKHTKQKKITKFLINISKKNNYFISRLSNFIFFILLQSHFFFFINDINYFLKNNFIFVNNKLITSRFYELKPNDCVSLVKFNSYFDYISNIYRFFKKKISKIKYRQWKNFKLKKISSTTSKKWLPIFLNKFLFFKLDIPKYLEVDFFTLSIIYLYSEKNIIYKNKIFYKFISFYMLKLYNWKKLN